MTAHVVFLVCAAVALTFMVELLRRRQIKEKYAVLWLAVSVVMVVLAVYPPLLKDVARKFGVVDPPNLLLFVAVLFLLVVCVHLSWEVSRLEDRSRALAEELGLLRLQLEDQALAAPTTRASRRPARAPSR